MPDPTDVPRDYLSLADVAYRLSISTEGVRRLVHAGSIAHTRIGTRILISQHAYAAYLASLQPPRRRGRPPLSLATRPGRDAQQQGVG